MTTGKKKEETVTMTPHELAAFVKDVIAEDRAKREAEAKPVAQPALEPITTGFQRPPANPEFEAALLAIFDAETADDFRETYGGSVPLSQLDKAVANFYGQLRFTQPNKRLVEMYEAWRRHPVTHELLYEYDERQQLAGYIANLDFRRRSPSVADQVRQRTEAGWR